MYANGPQWKLLVVKWFPYEFKIRKIISLHCSVYLLLSMSNTRLCTRLKMPAAHSSVQAKWRVQRLLAMRGSVPAPADQFTEVNIRRFCRPTAWRS